MIGTREKVWKLGHVYDMTEYFDKMVKEEKIIGVEDNCYKHGYYLCGDVLDTHIYRIQVGVNAELEKEERTKIIEINDVSHEKLMDFCIEKFQLEGYDLEFIDTREKIEYLIYAVGLEELLKAIVEYDYDNGFENCDVNQLGN